jgi:hypothetical protein
MSVVGCPKCGAVWSIVVDGEEHDCAAYRKKRLAEIEENTRLEMNKIFNTAWDKGSSRTSGWPSAPKSEPPERGLRLRYSNRTDAFRRKFGPIRGTIVHHFWWVLHNCIVHPLVGILPFPPLFALHDLTSDMLDTW